MLSVLIKLNDFSLDGFSCLYVIQKLLYVETFLAITYFIIFFALLYFNKFLFKIFLDILNSRIIVVLNNWFLFKIISNSLS